MRTQSTFNKTKQYTKHNISMLPYNSWTFY